MSIPTYTLKATNKFNSQNLVAGPGDASNLKILVSSQVTLTAGATGRTVKFGSVPSNARIAGFSRVYNDSCATSGAPLLSLGLAGADQDPVPAAIGSGVVTLATQSVTGYAAITSPSKIGKKAYELMSLDSDPGEILDVYGTQTGAATTKSGTITVALLGYLN